MATSEVQGDQPPVKVPQKDTENVRSVVVPDAPEVIVEMNTKEDEKLTKKPQTAENMKKKAVNAVPVRIMEVADAVKEDTPTKNAKIKEEKNGEPMKEGVDENMKQVEKIAWK